MSGPVPSPWSAVATVCLRHSSQYTAGIKGQGFWEVLRDLPLGEMVRIFGNHPKDPGSNPGGGGRFHVSQLNLAQSGWSYTCPLIEAAP